MAEPIRADNWELRCRFNRAMIHERGLVATLYVVYSQPKPASNEVCQAPNTMSQMLFYYADAAKTQQIAIAHRLIRPAECGGETRPDPKYLRLNEQEYKQKRGPIANREPERALPDGDWREFYKCIRRACCRFLGEGADKKLAPYAFDILQRMSKGDTPTAV
jgi:hypothetical protein